MVVKPSRLTSLSAIRLAELAAEAGIPDGVLNVVPGPGGAAGAALGRHMDVDKVTFTGSTEVGRLFLQYSADSNLKEVTLECGGKSPAVVLADPPDLDLVVEQVLFGALMNQGENCSQGSRLIVHRSVQDELVSRLAAGLAACHRPEAEEVAAAARDAVTTRVDGSLLALVPLGVAQPDEVAAVGETLVGPGGGVHRHAEDVYYGGGEWLLLTAFRGWERLLAGDEREAHRALDWVAAHATDDGLLPEQAQEDLLHPDSWEYWVEKWGPPPCPLLWSHAMFLTLAHELGA